jgi:hypothetical protein
VIYHLDSTTRFFSQYLFLVKVHGVFSFD